VSRRCIGRNRGVGGVRLGPHLTKGCSSGSGGGGGGGHKFIGENVEGWVGTLLFSWRKEIVEESSVNDLF
jgi:hypothetical protein